LRPLPAFRPVLALGPVRPWITGLLLTVDILGRDQIVFERGCTRGWCLRKARDIKCRNQNLAGDPVEIRDVSLSSRRRVLMRGFQGCCSLHGRQCGAVALRPALSLMKGMGLRMIPPLAKSASWSIMRSGRGVPPPVGCEKGVWAELSRLIAIVDDEPDLVELVTVNLKKASFEARGFTDARAFFRFLERKVPDLVILDLMLPDMDGMEICKRMKKDENLSSVPVIILSARSGETDKVLGLELGADDYVTKPFSPRELVARVKAVLRREEGGEKVKAVSIGNALFLDPERHEVKIYGRKVDLTTTEFKILALLASKAGRVFSRDEILDHLWGHEKAVLDRTVDVHIRHLREKLGRGARMVKNVRGVGYKFEA